MPEAHNDTYPDRQRAEVRNNFKAFEANLDEYMAEHAGEFALMRDRKVVKFCGSWEEASATGRESFPDRLFSIQKVTTTPGDIGQNARIVGIG